MIEHAGSLCAAIVKPAQTDHRPLEPGAKHDVWKTLQPDLEPVAVSASRLNPETPFEMIETFLGKFDMLLVMTVHPGFWRTRVPRRSDGKGQARSDMESIAQHKIDIEVDGGINPKPPESSVEMRERPRPPVRRFFVPGISQSNSRLRGDKMRSNPDA